MHPLHRLADATLAASWTALLAIVGVDELGPGHPPDGVRALAVTIVITLTLTRATTRATDRICAVLSESRATLERVQVEQRAIVALGEEIGEQRALMHMGTCPHHTGQHRPHRPQVKYNRDAGWVS